MAKILPFPSEYGPDALKKMAEDKKNAGDQSFGDFLRNTFIDVARFHAQLLKEEKERGL